MALAAPAAAADQADFNGDGFDDLVITVPYEDVGTVQDAGIVHVLYGSSTGAMADGDQVWSQNSLGIADGAEAGDRFGRAVASGDFDGDGFDDLAVGVPNEDRGATEDAGAVHVLRGSAAGLTATDDLYLSQNSPGIADGGEPGDRFGLALAAADFGSGAHDDLAIGVPGESIGGGPNGFGALHVLLGSGGGLTSTGSQLWTTREITDGENFGSSFGAALAAGDFGGSAREDLAIGAPLEGVGAGAVYVLPGAANGLTATGSQHWTQDSPGIAGTPGGFDRFGESLAAADFGGSPQADLAIGVAGEPIGSLDDIGAVHVLSGSASGLTAAGDQYWTQNSPGVTETAEGGERFGSALAAADFGGTAHADLAIEAPTESVGPFGSGGAVHVLSGSPSGLTAAGDQYWTQNTPGIAGTVDSSPDAFGASLAAADYGNSAHADLMIANPSETGPSGPFFAGAVHVLRGDGGGLTADDDQFWTQDSPRVLDVTENDDNFGERDPRG